LLGAVLVLVAVTVIFSGCVAQTPPATNQSSVLVVANNMNPSSSIPTTYQDTELRSIGVESSRSLGIVISKISIDAAGKDIASLKTDSASLSSMAGNYYFQMKDLNVSPKYQVWKTNYLMGLLDAQTAGDYFSKSAILAQSEDYKNASTYLEQGNTLFQRSNTYLNKAMESIPE